MKTVSILDVLVALMLVFVTSLITTAVVNSAWVSDCEKLGVTRSQGKIYECSLRKNT